MEVVVGTYEELILGYHVIEGENDVQIKQSFTDHSHSGCLRSVAISRRKVLASGGTDETIRLLSLKKRNELGTLMEHSGSVTWLDFFRGTHMISCSEDGTLCIWKCFTWECIKTFKGHKGSVNCASIHPSGKLVLSVGVDRTLRMWNLVTGRSAYITNIKKVAEIVKWSPNGQQYVIVSNNTIDIYNTETELESSISLPSKINSIDFCRDCLVCGGEGGDVFFQCLQTNKRLLTLSTGTNRIKGLITVPSIADSEATWLITASSDGFIKIYQLIIQKDIVETKLLAENNTGFRLTCLAVTSQKTKAADGTSQPEQRLKDQNVEDSDPESDTEDESVSVKQKPKLQNKKKEKKIEPVKTKHKVRKHKKQKMKKLKSVS